LSAEASSTQAIRGIRIFQQHRVIISTVRRGKGRRRGAPGAAFPRRLSEQAMKLDPEAGLLALHLGFLVDGMLRQVGKLTAAGFPA